MNKCGRKGTYQSNVDYNSLFSVGSRRELYKIIIISCNIIITTLCQMCWMDLNEIL